MRYGIHTDIKLDPELTTAGEILRAVVDRLGDGSNAVLVEPEIPLHGITYMQVAHVAKTKGLLRKQVVDRFYQVELQEEKPNGDLYQYFCEIRDKETVLSLLCDFAESESCPDLAGWRSELFYRAGSKKPGLIGLGPRLKKDPD